MLATHVGVQFYTEHTNAVNAARQTVQPIMHELRMETGDGDNQGQIPKRNEKLANQLAADPTFAQAYSQRDRDAVANAVKAFCQRSGLNGFVTIFDSQGKVFYSGDSPKESGYKPHDMSEQILANIKDGHPLYGLGAPTVTHTICLVGMAPITSGASWSGMVAVCEPINGQFLTGLREKMKLTDGIGNAELLLFSVKDGVIAASTPGMMQDPYAVAISQKGVGLIDEQHHGYECYGRYWTKYNYDDSTGRPLAYLLVGTTVPEEKKTFVQIAVEAGLSLIIAIFLAIIFSLVISSRWNSSMRFLAQRAKDLASQKQNLPPLDGLSREFLELGEQMDTAVTGTRLSIKNLQAQMGRHQEELQAKHQQIEEANSKVDAINRQFTIQGRQLSEVSKQINQATAQSILLQQKLASVLQISTEGFLILDAYGTVIAANPTLLNWAGCTETEIAGKYCFEIVCKPGEPRGNGQFGAFSMHNQMPGDLINHFFPEGNIYHAREEKITEVIVHLQPLMSDDQNVNGYIMVLRDKTLHSEASRLRNEIVAVLQDSIRAPLAVAEQKWGRVLSTSKEANNSQLGNSLVDLHLTYQQLLGMVDSLLMMHTGIVPAAPIIREQISVSRLLGDCLEQCVQVARDHQVMLDYKTATTLPTTAVDEHLVRDAMLQLLEKMVSVTAPGGRVRVESNTKGNEIRTSVFSSGPALPPDEVEDMFAGFINGKHADDTYSQRFSLYLVRNNIERIGGRIWAESDRGTYIYMVLPVQ
jgi:signal transduction histidine kinase